MIKRLFTALLGIFFLFMMGACIRPTVAPKSLPNPDQPATFSNGVPDKPTTQLYDIYLSKKSFDQIDLAKIVGMDEEAPTYVITCKSYEIDLKKSVLMAKGVMVIASTDSRTIGTIGEDLSPIKMWADQMQIYLSIQNGWHTCIIVEKKDKQYFVLVYGRVHKPGIGAPYELVLPRTKIE